MSRNQTLHVRPIVIMPSARGHIAAEYIIGALTWDIVKLYQEFKNQIKLWFEN
jgi:hypothetical protein